jgi:riboflavin kinase/FMN adenylyltransferase
MLVVTDIQEVDKKKRPLVLAMGCFDGVHIGHQAVISTAVQQANKLGGEAWVYTFNPHPAKVLVPHKAPPLISAKPCRLRQIEALGVTGIIEIPFTLEFAKLTPEEFLQDLIAGAPTLAGVVCGQDWSFGCLAAGKFQTLETFGEEHGFTATAVAPVMNGELKISSTTIRNMIAKGDIPAAAELLGRPFSLFGKVVQGKKIGRELGYPTANIAVPPGKLIPANGVYAGWVTFNGERHMAATNVGYSPTFGNEAVTVEAYLLDFDRDIYGETLTVSFETYLRPEMKFDGLDKLIAQMGQDVENGRQYLTALQNA